MTLANAHPIFVGLKKDPSYLAQLDIQDEEHSKLMEARTIIRKALREASSRLENEKRFWRDSTVFAAVKSAAETVAVKFLMQGSFAYRTLNSPAKPYCQEIDLDDGMYVPVRFMQDSHPALAAGSLFTFVEETLGPVCKAKGWQLDSSKNTCARVRLWKGAHIDIPIYSVPEDRFQLMKSAIADARMASISFSADKFPSMAAIPTNLVMLAQRDGKWIQSDPKQLHDWVQARSKRYGPVYRRLCRFFKGWRDHVWENSPLSSICLMCAVDAALIELGGNPVDDRDDLQILEVARLLPNIFRGEINNPVVERACLNGWSDADRNEIVRFAEALADEMDAALERTGHPDIVIDHLRNGFGLRIPNRPDIIAISKNTASSVRAVPAATVPTPKIIDSNSG